MKLAAEIANWNEKSASTMESVYLAHAMDGQLTNQLVAFLDDSERQVGASWMLKRHLEQGARLSANQVTGVHQSLQQLQHWGARLHVLQAISHWSTPSRDRTQVESFVRQQLKSENKFIRAWAFHGLHHLACQFPGLQVETERELARAVECESASVRARVRKLIAAGF